MSTDANVIPATGRIDLHSHLLPGVDDGCRDVTESLACVRTLIGQGYVGTVCTPHVWPEQFPQTHPFNIARWVVEMREHIADAGLDYHLWTGGEVRLCPDVIATFEGYGVPTLGDSKFVLVDFWTQDWPGYVDRAFAWLLDRGYTPILAHPERLGCVNDLLARLDDLADMGMLLQGNLRCLTGEEGLRQLNVIQRLLQEDRYAALAMDMHRPDSLASRIDGLTLAVQDLGAERVTQLTDHAPRRIVLG